MIKDPEGIIRTFQFKSKETFKWTCMYRHVRKVLQYYTVHLIYQLLEG